ncbi:hypothetical protein AgCh_038702 [Apium graveolens]
MGERKVLNKYYSPDFNPAKIPRRKVHAINNQIKVHMMLSMNIRCNLCGNYIGKGTKFNSRKEEVIGQRYLDTIKIFRFYIKCPACCSEITVITDPQNSDYIVESGASRNFEPWHEEQETREVADAMESLENRARGLKREMGDVVALEELRFIKSRHADVSVDALINHLVPEKKDELCQEDEALIKSEFSGLEKCVRRIDDFDDEEDILDSKNNNIGLKKTRVSGDFTCARYICGKGSCATLGDKLILSHICAVKKKPEQKALERTGNKDKTKNDQANKTLQSLFKDYESDEEDS